MNNSADRRFRHALALRDSGKLRSALRILRALRQERPDSAALFAVIGGAYWELQEIGPAIEAFRESASLAPQHDLPSRGLVLSLVRANRLAKAVTEMKRFLAIRSTARYREMVRDVWELCVRDVVGTPVARSQRKSRLAIQEIWDRVQHSPRADERRGRRVARRSGDASKPRSSVPPMTKCRPALGIADPTE